MTRNLFVSCLLKGVSGVSAGLQASGPVQEIVQHKFLIKNLQLLFSRSINLKETKMADENNQ